MICTTATIYSTATFGLTVGFAAKIPASLRRQSSVMT